MHGENEYDKKIVKKMNECRKGGCSSIMGGAESKEKERGRGGAWACGIGLGLV